LERKERKQRSAKSNGQVLVEDDEAPVGKEPSPRRRGRGSKGESSVLRDPGEIVRALKRFRDCYDPRTTSVLSFTSHADPHGDPFRRGFISHFEERAELIRRLRLLDERERLLLLMWHTEGRPVTEIARLLGMSRVHAYRVQRKALDQMLSIDEQLAPENVAAATA
jgi:DNA-directed RNA polymerase specialized sigma24 family protein